MENTRYPVSRKWLVVQKSLFECRNRSQVYPRQMAFGRGKLADSYRIVSSTPVLCGTWEPNLRDFWAGGVSDGAEICRPIFRSRGATRLSFGR
ncbi:MAG: hypothetical protein DWH78_11075 [Planctomycetota bacterium]|nr:MAG: hypothetical protein DWH78_11075 [Planctomycetota bacterium]